MSYKTSTSQSNPEEKEQGWRHYNTWFQNLPWSISKPNSTVLAEKQTYRPTEKNRESVSKTMYSKLTNFQQRKQEPSLKKGKFLQYMLMGKVDTSRQKKETRSYPKEIRNHDVNEPSTLVCLLLLYYLLLWVKFQEKEVCVFGIADASYRLFRNCWQLFCSNFIAYFTIHSSAWFYH